MKSPYSKRARDTTSVVARYRPLAELTPEECDAAVRTVLLRVDDGRMGRDDVHTVLSALGLISEEST